LASEERRKVLQKKEKEEKEKEECHKRMQKEAYEERERIRKKKLDGEAAREVEDLGWSYQADLPCVEGWRKKWIDSPPKCYSSDSDDTVMQNFKGNKHFEKKRKLRH
jgi:hypothetical protein